MITSQSFSLCGILEDRTKYIQYRVNLETENPDLSAYLEEVEVTFSGTSGIDPEESFFSITPSANPSWNNHAVNLQISQNCNVCITLYDFSGRVVESTSGFYVTGSHTIEFTDLKNGIYFCQAESGDHSTSLKLAVVD